jgi:glycerol kinase
MAEFIGAIAQGTTSTRFMVFDGAGRVIGTDQKEHRQYYPSPGWSSTIPSRSGATHVQL